MLKDLGCSSNAARIAEIYLTDDRSFKRDYKLVRAGLGPVLKFVFMRTGESHSLGKRARAIADILRNGNEISRSLIETRCTRGADIARLLRFPEAVAQGIAALDEHWDGGGKPLGLSHEAIPLAARLALLAQIADVFFTNAGPEAARAEIARNRGGCLDPELCDLFQTLSDDPGFWRGLGAADIERRLLALEPIDGRIALDEDYLDDIAAAFGQVIDAKSPYTGGHSERVGLYTEALARRMGIAEAEIRALRRAAMLHDVGKLSISSMVLEKPGKLDDDEWEVMRSHAMQTTEILSRIKPLQSMAMVAGSHHERLDGRGYPLGLDATMLAVETRIITVCDFFDALTADRPYRGAMPVEKAIEIMRGEVGAAIDGDCFAALCELVTGGLPERPLPKLPHLLT
jgi:putative nucleotidyltransferase with HDIG domain